MTNCIQYDTYIEGGIMLRKDFPGNKERKRKEAQERRAISDKILPILKLAKLDSIFGEGLGAKKERAKLQKLIANPSK